MPSSATRGGLTVMSFGINYPISRLRSLDVAKTDKTGEKKAKLNPMALSGLPPPFLFPNDFREFRGNSFRRFCLLKLSLASIKVAKDICTQRVGIKSSRAKFKMNTSVLCVCV